MKVNKNEMIGHFFMIDNECSSLYTSAREGRLCEEAVRLLSSQSHNVDSSQKMYVASFSPLYK